MCKECNQSLCPPSCPQFEGRLPRLGRPLCKCSLCDAELYEGEFYYLLSHECVCEDCMEYMTPSELAAMLGYKDTARLAEALGGKYLRAEKYK